MDTHRGIRIAALVALAACLLASTAGCALRPPSNDSSSAVTSGAGAGAVVAPGAPTVSQEMVAPQDSTAFGAGKSASQPDANRLIVSTVSMSIEVKDLDAGVSAVRALATKYGATIADLSVSAGAQSPQSLDTVSSDGSAITPGGASITLRVPAARLSAAERDAATFGQVISQTASESDVTQQHVDLAARLKNLHAEEARLRTFLAKARKVSEMLAIETELSRVRGDIESMQAQLTYLEHQAALATLTIALSEPGALVSPAAGGWGFSAAIRDGVRAAAEVTRGLITFALAVSPLALIALIAVLAVRWLVIRRRRRKLAQTASLETPGTPEAGSVTPDHAEPRL